MIETTRLKLRPITLDDASYILAQLNDPGWLKNIGDRGVRTLLGAKEYIDTKILSSLDNPQCAFFVVIRKDDPDKLVIGQCGVFKREGLEDPDLGFAFLENFCGMGYGYEAASAVMEYAYNDMQLKKLVAITSDNNEISQALLRKLGMNYTKDLLLPNIEGNNRYFE